MTAEQKITALSIAQKQYFPFDMDGTLVDSTWLWDTYLNTLSNNAYTAEITSALIDTAKEMPGYTEINYFLEAVWDGINRLTELSNRVIVLGTSVPETLFAALGIAPVWLLGGSMGSVELGDDALPRDTDPVARSAYGYLYRAEQSGGKNLIVVPMVNDNYRKLVYLLRRNGSEVHPVLIPPDKSEASQREWIRQMELLTRRLAALNNRIPVSPEEAIVQNRVLLLGSPVYFPNHKIPRLIGQAGLYIAKDFTFSDPVQIPEGNHLFESPCREFFRQDFSAAYVRNDSLFTAVSR